MWFCGHAIFYFKLAGATQESFLVYENLYLASADDADSAKVILEGIARDNEDLNEDGHLEVNGVKAAYIYAGMRKIIEVETHPDLTSPSPSELDKLEMTYSVYEVDSLDEVLALARGEMVSVLYRE